MRVWMLWMLWLFRFRLRFSCLAVLQLLPLPCNPPSLILIPPKHTQAHFGNITFLKFSFEFNLYLEYIQTKQKENLKAGTLLHYSSCQAPLVAAIDGEPTLPHASKLHLWAGPVSPPLCLLLRVRRRGLMLAPWEEFFFLPASGKITLLRAEGQSGRSSQTALRAEVGVCECTWNWEVRALPSCTCSFLVSLAWAATTSSEQEALVHHQSSA